MMPTSIPKWIYWYGGFISLIPISLALLGLYDHLLFFPFLEGMPFEQTIGGVVGPYLVRNFAQGVITAYALFYKRSLSMYMSMLVLRVFTDIMDFGIVVLSGAVSGILYLPIIAAFVIFLWGPTFYSYKLLSKAGYPKD